MGLQLDTILGMERKPHALSSQASMGLISVVSV